MLPNFGGQGISHLILWCIDFWVSSAVVGGCRGLQTCGRHLNKANRIAVYKITFAHVWGSEVIMERRSYIYHHLLCEFIDD